MHLAAILMVLTSSALASSAYESKLTQSALKGDYQSQRNLAYAYSSGSSLSDTASDDYVPQDSVKACAWRKVILLSQAKKADFSDYSNESIDCQKVHATDNQAVWSEVHKVLSDVSKKTH
ncbi:hypothetical protein TUM17576_40100 [Enterobacter hormaechei]|nr:hypothetical protein TUM17576_40100 [Enterobacter hormaechei]